MATTRYAQEESIYALVPPAQYAAERPERHHSSFPGRVHPGTLEFSKNTNTKIRATGSFGTPNGNHAPSTSVFLKAHEKAVILPEPSAPSPKTKLRPEVPLREERGTLKPPSGANFITINAINAITSSPGKVPQAQFQWTTRPGYGDVPVYLRKNKARVAQEKETFETYVRMQQEEASNDGAMALSDGERVQLLHHLKNKWSSLNTAYQAFSLSVDSIPKKLRKEKMEKELAEVERDIKALQRGDMVLIVNE